MSVAGEANDTDPEIVEREETVTVDHDEPEDREPAKGAADDGEQRQSRRERRENRMREEREAREAAERERNELKSQLERQAREVAEMRGYLQAQQSQRDAGDPRAELNTQITKLENEAETHLERAAAARKAGDNDTYRREYSAYNAKMREAAKLDAKADMREEFQAELDKRLQAVGGISPQHLALRDTVMREFSWIATNAIARDAVDGEIGRICSATGRRPDDIAVIRQAATAVAKEMKLGGQQAPTKQQQQRYNGVRANDGGGGNGDASRIVVGKAEEKLAQAAFPQLEKKEAIKAWAKEMAKRQRSDD